MTFRDYMIQKLEALDPAPKKREKKTFTEYSLVRIGGIFKICIPKLGSQKFNHRYKVAITDFCRYFTPFYECSYVYVMAEMLLEKENLEAQTKEENQ